MVETQELPGRVEGQPLGHAEAQWLVDLPLEAEPWPRCDCCPAPGLRPPCPQRPAAPLQPPPVGAESHTHGPAVDLPAEGGGVQVFGLQVVQHTVPHPRDAAERGGLDFAEHLCQEALDGTGWGAGGPPRTQGS